MNTWGLALGVVVFGVLGYYLGHFGYSRKASA